MVNRQMREFQDKRYARILLEYYEEKRCCIEGLPKTVPDEILDSVKSYVHSVDGYNLNGCLRALEIGITRYIERF